VVDQASSTTIILANLMLILALQLWTAQ